MTRTRTNFAVRQRPSQFAWLTDDFRPLCVAIEYRGNRNSTDDETVRAALDAVPKLVAIIEKECAAYIAALTVKIAILEQDLQVFKRGKR